MIDSMDYDLLVKRVAYNLSYTGPTDIEDLIQEGHKALLRAKNTYDRNKGTFGSYARYWIRAYILDFIKKRDKYVTTDHLDVGDTAESAEVLASFKQEYALLKLALASASFSDREKYILQHRVLSTSPHTLQQISKVLKLSRERVRQIESEITHKLRDEFKKITNDYHLFRP